MKGIIKSVLKGAKSVGSWISTLAAAVMLLNLYDSWGNWDTFIAYVIASMFFMTVLALSGLIEDFDKGWGDSLKREKELIHMLYHTKEDK